MESCCRVCSRSDEFRRFSLYAVAEVSQEIIANMIRDTSDTQVSSEDGLPQHICPDCLMTLSLAYSFRKQCRRSDAKFREYWGGRTPSQSIDQQQQLPRRSHSQAPDDSSFEAVTTIKEEVDIYDYEYSVPSHDNQWVIQNPRTIGEGAMTVVHNSGQYYDEVSAAAVNDGSVVDRDGSIMPMVTTHLESHDPSEMGESSGLAQKGEKLKKKPPPPERYSQRIRRQEVSTTGSSNAVPRISEPEWSRFSVNVFQEGPLASTSEKTVTNPGQLRCEHCKKKMKKPYKHRNGKCLVSKNKSTSRPKCAYCHQTFVSSKGIPGHLRNSCRIYRQVCEAKGIGLPVFNQHTDHSSSPAVTPSASVTNETPEPKIASPVQSIHFDQKPRMRRTKTSKWNPRFSCQYCSKKFTKKSNLIRHQQKQCEILLETHDENISAIKTTADVTVSVPLPLRESQDDKSAIVKDQHNLDKLPEEETKCIYCQQNVNKKTRFLHHNGRCVLGRVNADHPCPYCPEAFSSRSLLLKHRCESLQEEQNEQNNVDTAVPSESQPLERKQRRTSKLMPKRLAREKTPIRETSRKRRDRIIDVSPKSIVKREFCTYCRQRIKESDRQKHKEKRCFNNNATTYNCGYCRKSFAARELLIEHQRICTVRKQHKQVKCQFCGAMISNRGNLKKHQKVYCKSVKRGNDVKSEKPPVVKEEKPVKKKKRVKKEVHDSREEDVENIPLKQRKIKSKSNDSTEHKMKKKRASKKHRFPCENCKLTFATESRARKHGSKCSAKPTTNSFICEYCSQSFSTKSNMYRHQRLMCSRLDPDEDIVNETIKEFSQPKTTEASNLTVEEMEDEEQPDPTEDPLSDPKPAPCTEQSRTESVQSPVSNDDGDNDDEYVPEPEAEEEIIVPEEHLPMEKEEVVVAVEAHDDPHDEPDNNNAEAEKASTEAVRLPTVAPVIERNEDSQHDEKQLSTAEEIVPDCESEREPMQVEHSAN
ncbi:zinc finger protein 473-like [Ochlerotatus camptorhynchus]|uniref:zinc finger protein 473-like n=1 Tax=Ochlerotatus camptorhynchus TaxID=644619 RepID=UPI0031D82A4C